MALASSMHVCAEVQDWSARPKPPVALIAEWAPNRRMEPSSLHMATHAKRLPPALMIRSLAKYSTKNKQSNFKAMP